MSGHAKALYFWVLQRHSIHGEAELRKVAGWWKAQCRIVFSLQSLSFALTCICLFFGAFSGIVCCEKCLAALPFDLPRNIARNGVVSLPPVVHPLSDYRMDPVLRMYHAALQWENFRTEFRMVPGLRIPRRSMALSPPQFCALQHSAVACLTFATAAACSRPTQRSSSCPRKRTGPRTAASSGKCGPRGGSS